MGLFSRLAGTMSSTFQVGGPKGPNVALVPGTGGAVPPSWLVTDWYLDGTNGVDSNSGTDAQHPVKTITGGLFPKWGTSSPTFAQSVTIHVLVGQAPGLERCILQPQLVGVTANFVVAGTPATVGNAFPAGAVTPKSQGNPGTDLTIANMPAGAAAGVLVQNVTRGSYAFIYSMNGTTATMEQPFPSALLTSPSLVGLPVSEDDTWATSDTLQMMSVPALNLLIVEPFGGDTNAAFTKGTVWLQMLHIPQPPGTGLATLGLGSNGAYLTMASCVIDPQPGNGVDNNGSVTYIGCHFNNGGVFSIGAQIAGGGFVGGALGQFFVNGGATISNDTIVGGLPNTGDGQLRTYGMHLTVSYDVDGPSSSVDLMGTNALWGAGSLNLDPFTVCRLDGGTWANALKLAGLTVNSHPVAMSAAQNGVTYGPFLLTAANLDTYGGLFDPISSAAFVGNTTHATPVTWGQTSWFIDPQNAQGTSSDNNDGKTSGTALRTWAGFVSKMGVQAGAQHRVTVTVTFLSSHTDSSDPVIWAPIMEAGAVPVLIGKAPTSVAATFTLNGAKNRAAGSNAMLSGSFSAGAPAVGLLVQNTTAAKSSRAFIYKSAGGANWAMTQPVALQAQPQSAVPAEVDTWANTDTVNILTMVQVNVVTFAPVFADIDSTVFNKAGYLSQLIVLDPNGVGFDGVYLSNVWSQDVQFQRTVQGYSAASAGLTALGYSPVFSNCFFSGGINMQTLQSPVFWAGAAPGTPGAATTIISGIVTANTPGVNNQTPLIDGDFISGTLGAVLANVTIGLMFMDNNVVVPSMSQATFATGLGGSHVLYGTAAKTLSFQGNARGYMASGTFTAGWTAPTLVTGVTMNGATTASCHTGADPDVIHTGRTTSVANLDATVAGGGFGGLAFNLGGATLSNAA